VPSDSTRDGWLSDVLGFDTYWVTADAASTGTAPGRALSMCRVSTGDVASVRALEGAGFNVVDVTVTLERSGSDGLAGAEVAPAAPEQHAELLQIAGTCFRYSRFHLDPLVSQELADRVKREWVRSYVEGRRGIELLAAERDGRPLGFLAVLEASDGARVIDLVGVATDARGRGVGEALVAEFARRHGDSDRVLRVGTQIANVASLRLYEKLGFRIVSSQYVLHRHESS
jgi:ribosomal protein S18 acetylase RimI-like enzyme